MKSDWYRAACEDQISKISYSMYVKNGRRGGLESFLGPTLLNVVIVLQPFDARLHSHHTRMSDIQSIGLSS